jgi:hypothetical protein
LNLRTAVSQHDPVGAAPCREGPPEENVAAALARAAGAAAVLPELVVSDGVWANVVDTIQSLGASSMSIVLRFTPTALTVEQYEEVVRKLEESEGGFPPDGLDYHVCFGSDGNLRVSEIWDSKEQFDAFGERLMPILTEVGVGFSGPPEPFEVHNIVKR